MPDGIIHRIGSMFGWVIPFPTDYAAGYYDVSPADSFMKKDSMPREVENNPVDFPKILFVFDLQLSHEISLAFHGKSGDAAFQ